ncbi:MAG: Stp1/IreP family PP2C-type Ser/Thr phosphatase [Proteobacteria bacterium]|nr:Stp1/IreP family PP2C-type Ser/Thr phosphatase [Pseudomonadota bacterium]
MKRTHNEDTFSIFENENLFVVCDGMGGHASGEVASQMAVQVLKSFFKDTLEDPEMTWPYKMDRSRRYEENRLITGMKLANLRIHEASTRESKYHGMGTTVVAVFFVEDGAYLTHVGDSRIYRIRDGVIEQITEDHSLLNDYIKMKKLTPEEIKNFPHKNVIIRALGMKESVKVDTFYEIPHSGDVYLLCSDGLSSEMTDPEMLEIYEKHSSDLQVACHELIEAANNNGGHDNISVILVRAP